MNDDDTLSDGLAARPTDLHFQWPPPTGQMTPDLRRYCDKRKAKCEAAGWPMDKTVYLCRLLRMGGATSEADEMFMNAYNAYSERHGGPPAGFIDLAFAGGVVQWEVEPLPDPDDAPPAPETTRIR